MEQKTSVELSDGVKSAIVSNANQWSITNYHTVEKLRRNLLVSCVIGMFIGLTGAKPSSVAALGLEFSNVSSLTFYLISVFVTLYLYWSYFTRCRTGDIYRNNIGKIYFHVLGFNYYEEIVKSRTKFDILSYRAYRNILPLIAVILSLGAIVWRVANELTS